MGVGRLPGPLCFHQLIQNTYWTKWTFGTVKWDNFGTTWFHGRSTRLEGSAPEDDVDSREDEIQLRARQFAHRFR